MLIGVNGYAGSGKDTVGEMVLYLKSNDRLRSFEDFSEHFNRYEDVYSVKSGWEIKKFAHKLKLVAGIILGVPHYMFENRNFKDTPLGPEWSGITAREFIQKFGTEGVRDGFHPNTWVNALFADYNDNGNGLPNWVITDTRFPNEAKAIKDQGGIVIRIDRPGITPALGHSSETALDGWDFDVVISNDGTIDDLMGKVEDMLKSAT